MDRGYQRYCHCESSKGGRSNPIKIASSVKALLAMTVFIIISFVCSSCSQQSQKRHYIEIVTKPPEPEIMTATADLNAGLPGFGNRLMPGSASAQMPEGMVTPGSSVDLSWNLPSGWQEKPPGGMRLATFVGGEGKEAIECSIVSLGARAGGLEDNVRRWLGQINLPEVSDQELTKFIARQQQFTSQGGFPVRMIDLTQFQNDSQSELPSIMAAIVTLADKTIFVKITGSRAAVIAHREGFLSLCKSLGLPAPPLRGESRGPGSEVEGLRSP